MNRTKSQGSSSTVQQAAPLPTVSLRLKSRVDVVLDAANETNVRIRDQVEQLVRSGRFYPMLEHIDRIQDPKRQAAMLEYLALDICEEAVNNVKAEMIKNGEITQQDETEWRSIQDKLASARNPPQQNYPQQNYPPQQGHPPPYQGHPPNQQGNVNLNQQGFPPQVHVAHQQGYQNCPPQNQHNHYPPQQHDSKSSWFSKVVPRKWY